MAVISKAMICPFISHNLKDSDFYAEESAHRENALEDAIKDQAFEKSSGYNYG